MHWLAYKVEDNRVVWLRIVTADTRPVDVDVINNGFTSEFEALSLMAHYFETNEAGFLTVPRERAERHMTRLDRIALAYRIEPLLLRSVLGAYALIGAVLVALLLHILLTMN